MKTIIILEGASTSGKTTVMNLLSEALRRKGLECQALGQAKTVPAEVFSHPDPKRCVREIGEFLRTECAVENTVYLCDRLHLSQMAITNGSLEDFSEIERELSFYNPLLVFLEIPEEGMKERLINAKAYRSGEWEKEIKEHGSDDEAAEWYKKTQRKLFALYEESALPRILFDTGELGYEEITQRLVQRIAEEPWEDPIPASEVISEGE